jgi:hypothetical protein
MARHLAKAGLMARSTEARTMTLSRPCQGDHKVTCALAIGDQELLVAIGGE